MEYFLERIASIVFNGQATELGNQCLVFPNRRAGLYFLKYLASVSGRAVWAPDVKTINELFESSSHLKIAENEILIFELFRIYCELNPGSEKFDDFYFWGELLLNDFDDIDKYLADPGKLFENLADLKKIDEKFGGLTPEQAGAVKQFWVNFNEGSATNQKEDFIKIWSILPELYLRFRTSLREKGLAYEGMIYRDIAEKCLHGEIPDFGRNLYHFAGFNALNECEKILMKSLKKAGKARFYWDYDESYISSDKQHSAGYFIRDNLKIFGNDMPQGWNYNTFLSSSPGKIKSRIIETSSDISQVKLIPQLLEQLGEINADEAHHTAVILSDESLLVPVLSSIPDSVGEVNITMGYPLKYSPVYTLVHHLLSLQKNCRVENGITLFDHKDVLNIIRHTYYSASGKSAENSLSAELIAENRQWIPASRFSSSDIFSAIFKKTDSPGDLSVYLKSVLEQNFVSEEASGDGIRDSAAKLRNEFIYRTITALNRLTLSLSTAQVEISLITWTRMLDRIIRAISVPFSGEPLSGIQVMGILETRSLDFKNVILLSANEGILPKISGGSSYIPHSLREAYGLPGIRHQDSIFSYYFHRLLHRVENITFVYNSNSEGLRTGEMSRFLLQLNYLGKIIPHFQGLACEINTPSVRSDSLGRTQKHNELLFNTYLSDKGKPLSPSAVNTWLTCRMKFYFRYICGIREPEKITTEVDPAVFGTLLHSVMEEIYSGHTGKEISRNFIEELLKRPGVIDQLVSSVISKTFFIENGEVSPGSFRIIGSILANYAKMILIYDSRRAPFIIEALEKGVFSKIDKVSLGGYIDRLDRKNDSLYIIDYKTGNIKMDIPSVGSLFDESDDKRNESWFQILTYCEIIKLNNNNENVTPVILALRNLNQRNYSGNLEIKPGNGELSAVNEYSLIRDEFRYGLVSTLEKIFSNSEPFTKTVNTRKCEYCIYRQLCGR